MPAPATALLVFIGSGAFYALPKICIENTHKFAPPPIEYVWQHELPKNWIGRFILFPDGTAKIQISNRLPEELREYTLAHELCHWTFLQMTGNAQWHPEK